MTACATCEGHGERGIRQDYWGNWESETCPDCEGSGSTWNDAMSDSPTPSTLLASGDLEARP